MEKRYNKEFKENALRIAERDGVKAANEKLGIRKHAIYEWRRDERLKKCGVISGEKTCARRDNRTGIRTSMQ